MPTESSSKPVVAAIYARQSVKEEQGIAQQLDDCRAEVRRRGWQLAEAHEYFDDGTSGSKERGPNTDWAKMLKAFDDKEFSALVVNDADRLTRNLSDVLEVRSKRDVRIIVVRGNIDTAEDDYMLKQLVLLAEREVRLKTKRMERYAAERRKKGHPTAGRTPHGYRWVPEVARDEQGRRWAIDPQEADEVRRIFNEFLAGAAMKQIARDLNADGSLPKSAKSLTSTRKAKGWGSTTVRGILMNPVYAALLPPAQPTGQFDSAMIDLEECTAGNWEAIVSRDQVQTVRAKLVGAPANHSGTARRWMLPGLAKCGKCNGPVRSAVAKNRPKSKKGEPAQPPTKSYHAYRCATRGKGCFQRAGDIIDELVSETMIERLARKDLADLFKPVYDGPDITTLHAERKELEDRDGGIAMLIAKGKMKPEPAEKALEEINRQLKMVNAQIVQAVRQDPLAELAGVDNVRAWWEHATLARKRALIDLLMNVTIYPSGHGKRSLTTDQAGETVTIEWKV